MNYTRTTRKNKKKEELPSFLLGLTYVPDVDTFTTRKASLQYLGPIFVGKCSAYPHHPPPHSLKLGSFHQPQYSMLPGNDEIAKLFLPTPKTEKRTEVIKPFHPRVKRKETFPDPYTHRAPGRRKGFMPEVRPHVIDLGQTESIIEGEAVMEIPIHRSVLNNRSKRRLSSKPELEYVKLSDIREKNRKYMSYEERIAHAHFPKEFATVRVIGPTIPASITITKLPSKRKTRSEINLEVKQKVEEVESKEEKDKEKEKEKEKERKSTDIKKREPTVVTSKGEEGEKVKRLDDHIEEKMEEEPYDLYEEADVVSAPEGQLTEESEEGEKEESGELEDEGEEEMAGEEEGNETEAEVEAQEETDIDADMAAEMAAYGDFEYTEDEEYVLANEDTELEEEYYFTGEG